MAQALLLTIKTINMAKIFNRGVVVNGSLQMNKAPAYMPAMTTAERDEFDVENGAFIYNTTTDAVNVYADGAWEVVTFDGE